jgi:hypothetical protein
MATNLLIGLLVLFLILRRQLRQRPLREDRSYTALLVIGVLGLVQIGSAWQKHAPVTTGIVLLVASFVVAAAFGAGRASTVRIWRAEGQLWRQGTYVTAALWILAVAVHLGIDLIGHVSARSGSAAQASTTDLLSASIVLYLAVSFGAQRAVLERRVARLDQPRGSGPGLSGS